MLTSFGDDDALVAAVMAGAAGFVLKQVRGTELVEDVRKVANGAVLLDAATVKRVVDQVAAAHDDELAVLTPQERILLDHIAEGLTNRQIGIEMCLAEKTIKNYVSNLLTKLGMHRRTEAAVYAARVAERRSIFGDGSDGAGVRRLGG
jgi:DNA-binding NarL/FixJ family response regulator